VVPPAVIVFEKFIDRMLTVALVEENHPVSDLPLDCTAKALYNSVNTVESAAVESLLGQADYGIRRGTRNRDA
jgi:hypothetical protein